MVTDEQLVSGLRKAMKIAGRTIRSLSESTGIPYRTLQNYLGGTSKMPATVFVALCQELAASTGFILHDSFELAHSTVSDALYMAVGDAVFHSRGTNTPLHLANLNASQRRQLADTTQRFNQAFDALSRAWMGQLGYEVEPPA